MSNALDDLIAAVEVGTFRWNAWAEPALDRALMAKVEDAYHGSLDAAKSLHEAVLNSIDPQYGYLVGPQYAAIIHPSGGRVCDASTSDPARSWLLAILRAMREGKDA